MSKNIKRLTLQLYALPGQFRRGDYSEAWWICFFRNIRDAGFQHVETFAHQWEPGGIWNKYQPFKKTGKDFDLAVYDEKWWKDEVRLVRCAKAGGVNLETVIISKYQEYPYVNNVNGVTSMIADRKAWPIQARLARRLYQVRRSIYGDDRILFFRTSNEVAHNGDHAYGFTINNHHSFLVGKMVGSRIKDYKQIVSDTSRSDFTAICEPHYYLEVRKDGGGSKKVIATHAEYIEYLHNGQIIQLLDMCGKEVYDRKSIVELHGVNHETLLEPVEAGADMSLFQRITSCAWRFWRLSTDGSDRGSIINPLVSWPFRDMNKSEIRKEKEILAEAPGHIQFFIAELPKSPFFTNSDGIIEEDFALLEPDLDRLSEWAS